MSCKYQWPLVVGAAHLVGFVVHMGCLHCHSEYTKASKQSCATAKSKNKVYDYEQKKGEKAVVVNERNVRIVCMCV